MFIVDFKIHKSWFCGQLILLKDNLSLKRDLPFCSHISGVPRKL